MVHLCLFSQQTVFMGWMCSSRFDAMHGFLFLRTNKRQSLFRSFLTDVNQRVPAPVSQRRCCMYILFSLFQCFLSQVSIVITKQAVSKMCSEKMEGIERREKKMKKKYFSLKTFLNQFERNF